MRQIEPGVFVGGQIEPANLPALAVAGVRTIVNNRPDHEERGQPTSDEIGVAAGAAGLIYAHIPIAGGFSVDAVARAREALRTGSTLLFCKSGMRSAALWALARAAEGAAPDMLIDAAAAAGQDIRMMRPLLVQAGLPGTG